MNRISILILLAALSGCATTSDPSHRVGAVNNYNNIPCENVSLTSSTTFSTARLTLGVDTLGFDIVTSGTWNGSYGMQESNDNVNWIDVTLPNVPPASAGSPQVFGLSYEGGWAWAWGRAKFVGTSSTGSASVCLSTKG